MAWVSAIISLLTLASMIYTGVFHYANLQTEIKTSQAELARNFKDDEKRADLIQKLVDKNHSEDEKRADHLQRMIDKNHEFTVKAVERIDTNLGMMSSLNVKIGILETKLEGITDILKRVERQMERRGPLIDEAIKRK